MTTSTLTRCLCNKKPYADQGCIFMRQTCDASILIAGLDVRSFPAWDRHFIAKRSRFPRRSGTPNPVLPTHLRALCWEAPSAQSPRGRAWEKRTLRNHQIRAGIIFAGKACGCHGTSLRNQGVKPLIHCSSPSVIPYGIDSYQQSRNYRPDLPGGVSPPLWARSQHWLLKWGRYGGDALLEVLISCEGEEKARDGQRTRLLSHSCEKDFSNNPRTQKDTIKGDLFGSIRQRIRLLLQSVKFSMWNWGLFTFLYCHLITS